MLGGTVTKKSLKIPSCMLTVCFLGKELLLNGKIILITQYLINVGVLIFLIESKQHKLIHVNNMLLQ